MGIALLPLIVPNALLLGEGLRDVLYGEQISAGEKVSEKDLIPGIPDRRKCKKWKRCSSLFILLRQNWSLPQPNNPKSSRLS